MKLNFRIMSLSKYLSTTLKDQLNYSSIAPEGLTGTVVRGYDQHTHFLQALIIYSKTR